MTSMRFVLFAIIIAGLVFSGIPASARMPFEGFDGGGVIAPDHPHQSIRLDSLEVVIRLKNDGYEVDTVYELFNEGETVLERVVFPKSPEVRKPGSRSLMRFECAVNGKKLEFDEAWDRRECVSEDVLSATTTRLCQAPHISSRSCLTGKVAFSGQAVTRIHVSYEARYQELDRVCFIFGTGSGWKGAIGNAVVILDDSEMDRKRRLATLSTHVPVIGENSAGWIRTPRPISDRVTKYEFRDFKPDPRGALKVNFSKP